MTWNQCDQIGWFIGLRATFQCLWQQLFCPNLSHSQAILVKLSKSFILLVKSFLGNFYRHLATFYWSHWLHGIFCWREFWDKPEPTCPSSVLPSERRWGASSSTRALSSPPSRAPNPNGRNRIPIHDEPDRRLAQIRAERSRPENNRHGSKWIHNIFNGQFPASFSFMKSSFQNVLNVKHWQWLDLTT